MHKRFSYKEGLLPICDFLQIDELGQSMALQSHVKLLNSIACQVIVKLLLTYFFRYKLPLFTGYK